MKGHAITDHAARRMRQRGMRDADLALLLDTADQIAPDAYALTDRAAAEAIAARKREIQRLEKLQGWIAIVEGGRVITCYRAQREPRKRLMRRGRGSL